MILPFFYVGETEGKAARPQVSDVLKNGRHELQSRFDKTLTQRAGYGEFPDSILERYPNRKYRGEDFTPPSLFFPLPEQGADGDYSRKRRGRAFFQTGLSERI
jgi:hypothetical protein